MLEAGARPRIRAVPYAHLSVEVGHLYMEDYELGVEHLREHFRRVQPWVTAAAEECARALGGRPPRISTCFLVDDYFTAFGSPREIVPQLVEAAGAAGLRIDYLVRESGCATAGGVDLARLVESRLVDDPPPNTTGDRPPARETGWLCNGERTPGWPMAVAMQAARPWTPPRQNAANRHSIFVDVQLWEERAGEREWSCPYLAAVWQLLRLGLLRHRGAPVAEPVDVAGPFPQTWAELPAVARLSAGVQPFSAYRTFSVLAPRFLHIETAVKTILSQVAIEPEVGLMAVARARAEGLALPADLVERVEHVFAGSAWAD